MRNILKIFLVFSIVSSSVSCSGGNDDDPVIIEFTDQTTWEFEGFEYIGGASADQITMDEDSGNFGVLVISTDEDTSNGDYSGSAITVVYALEGPGNYPILSQDDYSTLRSEDNSAKAVVLSCTVGTASSTATRYDSMTGGTAAVNVDGNGKYHFSLVSNAMQKTVEVGDGVPNAPSTGTLRIINAFDF